MDMIKHEKFFFTGDPSILKEFDIPKSLTYRVAQALDHMLLFILG